MLGRTTLDRRDGHAKRRCGGNAIVWPAEHSIMRYCWHISVCKLKRQYGKLRGPCVPCAALGVAQVRCTGERSPGTNYGPNKCCKRGKSSALCKLQKKKLFALIIQNTTANESMCIVVAHKNEDQNESFFSTISSPAAQSVALATKKPLKPSQSEVIETKSG